MNQNARTPRSGATLRCPALVICALAVCPADSSHAGGGLEGWSIVASPNPAPFTNALLGVHAISTTDVWAVGYYDMDLVQALALHWNGQLWTQVGLPEIPGQDSVAGIASTSSHDVWAVGATSIDGGHKTVIMHFDGTLWSLVPSPNPDPVRNVLNAVVALSPTDAWAVGYQGVWDAGGQSALALHWNGQSWHVVPTPDDPADFIEDLSAVSALAPDDIWAVGATGLPQAYEFKVLHYDGTTWQNVEGVPQSGDYGRQLAGVVAFAPDNVWLAGHATFSGEGDQNVILHFDGTEWHETFPFCQYVCTLWDLTAAGPDNLLAVGDREIGGPDFPQAYRSDGVDNQPWEWIDLEEIEGNGTGHVRGCAMLPSGEAWVVGYRSPGSFVQHTRVYHFVPLSTPLTGDLDADGVVTGLDLALLLGQWTGAASYSPCPPHVDADINGDCTINGLDLALLLGAWG